MTSWLVVNDLWSDFVVLSALFETVVLFVTIPVVLLTKKESTSAVAWCLTVILLPVFGAILFALFGYQHVSRPLARKRKHKRRFERSRPGTTGEPNRAGTNPDTWHAEPLPLLDLSEDGIGRLATRFGSYPVTTGNSLSFYTSGDPAFAAMREAIAAARYHVHLEFFIFRPDNTGREFLTLLARKAAEGVEVRLLYDAIGSVNLHWRTLWPLVSAGGQAAAFLPINPLRRRLQVNLRDHRKILVVDGTIGFTGGLNIGDEYRGRVARFGPWRDTHLRVEGPAVNELQRIFVEDWDFATGENLQGGSYFPEAKSAGTHTIQVIESGPDRPVKSIREIYFAAILRAKRRVWIATPYFVPDAGLSDALRLAARLGLDVRILGQFHPDKWIPYFAGRYYWADMLEAGVKVYQYTPGMMHAKVMVIDGEWSSVGTANFDNRSLYLNFELTCLVYDPGIAAQLEEHFLHDLGMAIRLDREVYERRPLVGQLIENACRLASPVL